MIRMGRSLLLRYRDLLSMRPAGSVGPVLFVGDSITEAWGRRPFSRSFKGAGWVARGVGGAKTAELRARFEQNLLAIRPRVVVISGGTNDIAANPQAVDDDEIVRNLDAMAALARDHGIAVVLASILPVSHYHTPRGGVPETDRRPPVRIRAVNAKLQEVASSTGSIFLDYFAHMVDASGLLCADLSDDDLHPNSRGYAVMAPLATRAVAMAIA